MEKKNLFKMTKSLQNNKVKQIGKCFAGKAIYTHTHAFM